LGEDEIDGSDLVFFEEKVIQWWR